MGTIKNVGTALKYLLQQPVTAAKILYRAGLEHAKKAHVIETYGLNRGLPTVDLLDILPDLNETIQPYSFSKGIAHITDMTLLKGLARRTENCRFLEIGTQSGETISNVSAVAQECVSLSLSDQELKDMGFDEKYIKLQRYFSKERKNVEHIGHNSLTFDFSRFKQKFDLIFIDGDHFYNGVKSDTENAFQLLKGDNSVIVWHDCVRGYIDPRWEVLAAILDGSPKDKIPNIYHVSNSVCAIYINRKFPTRFTSFPEIPNKEFKIQISAVQRTDDVPYIV